MRQIFYHVRGTKESYSLLNYCEKLTDTESRNLLIKKHVSHVNFMKKTAAYSEFSTIRPTNAFDMNQKIK